MVAVLPRVLSQENIKLPQLGLQNKKPDGGLVKYFSNLGSIYKFAALLLYYRKFAICSDCLLYSKQRNVVNSLFLLGGSIITLVLFMLFLTKLRNSRRSQSLRKLLEQYQQSRQALVRYIMLNRQCSEEAAYQRIATFVKTYFPAEEHNAIDRLLENDKQSLLDKAGIILIHHPDDIDKM